MNTSYSSLLDRLDDFIRVYYRSKWTLGILYSFSAAILLFILLSSLEYFGYYGRGFRLFFLLLFLGIVAIISFRFFLLPFLAFSRLGKRMDYASAGKIIGAHFPEVKDKLINALQLSEMGAHHAYDLTLIEASINQKILAFEAIPFYSAIDKRKNFTYLKVLGILGFSLMIIFLISPSFLLVGSKRILSYQTDFLPPAPFIFNIQNSELVALKNGSFNLKIEVEGEKIPSEVYLDQGSLLIPCAKTSKVNFTYTFNNLQSDQRFRFYGSGFYSRWYSLRVYPTPQLVSFQTKIYYPSYINKGIRLLKNEGDFTVPEGSLIEWTVQTASADSLFLLENKTLQSFSEKSGTYLFSRRLRSDFTYTLMVRNGYVKHPDSFHYQIHTIKDAYPEIRVDGRNNQNKDSSSTFSGSIQDDYGFTKLLFHYQLTKSDPFGVEGKKEDHIISIPISKSLVNQPFSIHFHPEQLPEAKGKNISCFFEVFDNDGVNGPKSSRSEKQNIYISSTREDLAKKDSLEKTAQSDIKKALAQAKKLQAEGKNLLDKMKTSNSLSFEQKESLRDVLKEKTMLDSTLSRVRRENEESQKINNEASRENSLAKKNEEDMKSLLDSLMSKESKDLFERLSKILEENKLRETRQLMQKFSDQNKSLFNDLKRTEDLYKKLERDREIQNQIDLLHQLAKKEQVLSENTKKANREEINSISKSESDQQKQFDQVKNQLESIEKSNEKDKINPGFENPKTLERDISSIQQKTQEKLSRQNKEGAAELQKQNSSKMEDMSNFLSQMKQTLDAQELGINLHSLRLILENLLRISFKQEELIHGLHNSLNNDPSVVKYIDDQYLLKEAIVGVQDSLNELSHKVPAIKSFISKELTQVNSQMELLVGQLADRRFFEAQTKQQSIMTSINNLAVILSNVEKQMAQALSMAKGNSNKPGDNHALSSLISRQKTLNEQAGKIQSSESGEQEDETRVRLAAEQESIRKILDLLKSKAESKGKLASDLGEIQKEMQQSETEFLNKRIKSQNINLHKEILTRLLEADKAEKEQGMENKYQATAGKNYAVEKIKSLVSFLPEKFSEIEVLKTVPASVNFYYKTKINTYFNLLNDSQPRNEKLGTH